MYFTSMLSVIDISIGVLDNNIIGNLYSLDNKYMSIDVI